MKILLINPKITQEQRYGRFKGVGSHYPPLGLCYVAAVLEKAGQEVRIIDDEIQQSEEQEMKKAIKEYSPHIIGFTSNTLTIKTVYEQAKTAKETKPDAKIILGGTHVSALPQETLKECPHIDIGVVGEAEETATELVKAIEDGKEDLDNIKGIIYRKKGTITKTPPRGYIKDLDSIPLPARHLLPDLRNYHPTPASYRKKPLASIITSRGCPYNCTFCDKNIFGPRIRYRSAKSVMDEIDHLKEKYGIKEITIYDDTFTVDKKRVIEICGQLKKRRLIFTIMARANTLDEDMVKALKDAGCWQIALGIESGNQSILDEMNKAITIEQVRNATRIIHKNGIDIKGFFIIGNPNETPQTIEETIEFAKSLPLDSVIFTLMTPLPGTAMYNNIDRYGTLTTKDWSKYNMWETVYIPKGFTKDELEKKHKEAYRRFYHRISHITGALMKIRTPEDIRRYYQAAKALL